MRLVWSEAYEVDLFGHVFPVEKYRLIKDRLITQGAATEADFMRPRPAGRDDLLLVHTPEYVDDLINLRVTHRTVTSELALTREIADAYIMAAGGTIEAARHALSGGPGLHIGGGFHHAYPDHAEGFCYVNDVCVAIERLRSDGAVERVCVIDCDLHQGNGTAVIFAQNPDVFTFSIHQENNYPSKERSDLDIGLADGTDDGNYLDRLNVVSEILKRHRPEIVFYLAGADPFAGDMLGGLALTKQGLKNRDIFVFEECNKRRIPVCVVLAGGYASKVTDDVDIHSTTLLEAQRILG
ncbi:MAG: histone deacetylase [Candidatus Eisenbacteria bacterium]